MMMKKEGGGVPPEKEKGEGARKKRRGQHAHHDVPKELLDGGVGSLQLAALHAGLRGGTPSATDARSSRAASREAEHDRDDLLWQLRLPDHALLLVQHQSSVPKHARPEARAELLADLSVPRTRDPAGGKADVHVVCHAPTKRLNVTG